MTEHHARLGELLLDLECAMRRLDLWQPEAPPAAALASTAPFCIDTLELHQWLQFVFLPRMHVMVAEGLELPQACAIAPLATEVYKTQLVYMAPLLRELERVDELLSNPADLTQGSQGLRPR